MLQGGDGLDLPQEPLGADHRRQLGLEHLNGDLATVLEILGEIHRGHTALAQLPLDPVAVGEACLEALDRHLAAPRAMRARSTDVQFATTISSPALSGSRKMKCVPSGITS